MKFLKRLKLAWLVLIGKRYTSKFPAPGIKRNRKQQEIPFRMVER